MEELRLSQALVELSDPLPEGLDEAGYLQRLCRVCMEVLGVDEAVVHTVAGQELAPAARSHPERPLPQRLADPEDGPAVTAFDIGVPVHVADAAPERPATTLLSLPLQHGAQRLGALTLIRREPAAFSPDEVRAARALADIAAIRLAAARALAASDTLARQLRHALQSRILIEQAKGVIAAGDGFDMDAAFQQLRSYARHNGIKLRDAALAVVEGRLHLPP